MNNIIQKQNELKFIQLLKAQRRSYTIAKQCSIVEYLVIMVSIVVSVLLLLFPTSVHQSYVIIISGLLIVASILFDGFMKNKTFSAAKIQEEFDNDLFMLDWNDLLCESKVENEEIIRLAKREKEEGLKDWYSKEILSSLPHEIAVLFCQKTNVYWDKDLRKKFRCLLYVILFGYYIIVAIIAFCKHIDFDTLCLAILPSVTFLKYIILLIKSQSLIITKKENIIRKINNLFNVYRDIKEIPSNINLRELQNAIYTLRTNTSKVPNWFYRFYRNLNEETIDESVRMKIKQIN